MVRFCSIYKHYMIPAMEESGERDSMDTSSDGPSFQERRRRRLRRRPLHYNCRAVSIGACLLLASSSTFVLANTDDTDAAAAASSGTNDTTPPPQRLRRSSRKRNNNQHAGGKLSRERELSAKFCPGEYTGKAPTGRCSGYLDCVKGKPSSSVQSCASGTQYDVKSGFCTWPSDVDCQTGEDLLVQLGLGKNKDKNKDEEEEEEEEEESKFCPKDYTGRAPTTKCGGYVQCNNGKEGLSVKCPPKSTFNSVTSQCEYDLDVCSMLVGDDPSVSDMVGVNELHQFCPIEYNGRAPTWNCDGYVDCRNGEAKRSKNCPGDTKFDVMIMACTYGATGCDVLEDAGPTPSPITEDGKKGKKKDKGDEAEPPPTCPPGHTGYFTMPGCAQYLYCSNGNEVNKFDCSEGTLYYEQGGYCNWADQVTCETTRMPSYEPTVSPSSTEPTYEPTQLDIEAGVFYPNFNTGTCSGDGNFPKNVGRQYLFSNAANCCDKYFPTNRKNCLKASEPTPPPAPAEGSEWYPDYANDSCKNDGNPGPFETNFFNTYEDCCEFDYLNTAKCLRARPRVVYYPDYDTNSCRNDGEQSPFESNLFDTLEECCMFDWIDYGLCITGGSKKPTKPAPSPAGRPGVAYEFYPDYTHNVCHCDGRQSKFEINIFSSYESCCQFSLIDGNICRKYKVFQEDKCMEPGQQQKPASSPSRPQQPTRPSPTPPTEPEGDPIWYPDFDLDFCRDDGREPGDVLLTASYQECCSRFMSSHLQECRTDSAYNSVTLNQDGNDNSGSGSGGGGGVGSVLNQCLRLNQKKCGRDGQCYWNERKGYCMAGQQQQSKPNPTPRPPPPTPRPRPTNYPTTYPTRSPTPAPTLDNSCFRLNKKQCMKQRDRCYMDPSTERCTEVQPPTKAPVLPPTDPYYPDYLHGICVRDGNQPDDVVETYEDAMDCCKDPWIDYKTCVKHASGKKTLEQIKAAMMAGEVMEGIIADEDDSSANPYYPDYFYSVCRNDGRQPDWGINLFDTLEDCCGDDWIDYDSCMSNEQ